MRGILPLAASLLTLRGAPEASPAVPAGNGALEPFAREVSALRDVLGGGGLLLLLVAVLAGWAVVAGVARVLSTVRRTGYEGRLAWFGRVQVAVTGLVAISVLALLARFLLARAPLLSLALAVLFAGGTLLSLAVRLHQVAGGALLVLRGRVSEGDRLIVGGVEGTVERLGLTRLSLRRPGGAAVYLPTSLLDARPLEVAHRGRSRALEVRLERTDPVTAEDRERARLIAHLCPFRVLGTDVEVFSPDARPATLFVRLEVWGEAALRDADRFLRLALEAPASPPEPSREDAGPEAPAP